MKTFNLLIISSLVILLANCRVKFTSSLLQVSSELESLVDQASATQAQVQPHVQSLPIQSTNTDSDITYITILEGTHDIYGKCNIICHKDGKANLYTEITNFPNFGKIYRCQCDNKFSKWYSIQDNSEVSLDILLGDSLFNHYINLLGVNADPCSCDPLKALLTAMVTYN